MEDNFERFIISQAAIIVRDNKCLILEFADKPNFWGLPGGRIDKEETGEAAFKRELKEELGMDNFELMGVADYEMYMDKSKRPVCGIANLVRSDLDEIKLSFEHSNYKWISEGEMEKFNFVKPYARMIKSGFKLHKLLNNEK